MGVNAAFGVCDAVVFEPEVEVEADFSVRAAAGLPLWIPGLFRSVSVEPAPAALVVGVGLAVPRRA
ncbi:hypothetical protein ACWD25_29075 [Streptomyces sp. NPDC002920]